MKTRLLATLFATAMLGGCATYDYTSGSAPGGYYQGRPSVEYYGPYGGGYGYGYGYPSYGFYGSYVYGNSYRYGSPYYRSPHGYYPRYGQYPSHRHPHPPRRDYHDGHRRGDHDHHDGRGDRGDRPPPWRGPDRRNLEPGRAMVQPGARGAPPEFGQPGRGAAGIPMGAPRVGQVPPRSAPRPEGRAAASPGRTASPSRQPPQARPSPVPRAGEEGSRIRDIED